MSQQNEIIAGRLLEVAEKSYQDIVAKCAELSPTRCAFLLFECCRVLDYWHVAWAFDPRADSLMSYPDFDLIVRGWNLAVGLLMPRFVEMHGMPFAPTTSETVESTEAFLHNLGCIAFLRKAAGMLRHGMVASEMEGDEVKLRMSERADADHFRDQVDAGHAERMIAKERKAGRAEGPMKQYLTKDIDERMNRLLRPWITDRGTMTAYDAEPEVDDHFIALVAERAFYWRNEAGIHPDAEIGGVTGADLMSIGLLLISFYLKHIRFVMLAIKKHPEINIWMSLTIWKQPHELAESISGYTNIPLDKVLRSLDLFTIRQEQLGYFAEEPTPYIPMLIRMSEMYLLAPVSSIFRNPFTSVRMAMELNSEAVAGAIRRPRESWMIDDLIHLFMGSRYLRFDKPIVLEREGKTVTDIDAAILDTLTGELGLFQLKWQDFGSHSLKKQRSRAKNFVDQVDSWSQKLESWINEFGVDALAHRMHLPRLIRITSIQLFALGRSASRFQSYGYVQKKENTAVGTWPQFIRLREEIGPAPEVISALHAKLLDERLGCVVRKPIPYRLEIGGLGVFVEDIWSTVDDEQSPNS